MFMRHTSSPFSEIANGNHTWVRSTGKSSKHGTCKNLCGAPDDILHEQVGKAVRTRKERDPAKRTKEHLALFILSEAVIRGQVSHRNGLASQTTYLYGLRSTEIPGTI